jgi:hypothetical protein
MGGWFIMDDQLHESSDGLRFFGHISVSVNRSGPWMDRCILKLKASDSDGFVAIPSSSKCKECMQVFKQRRKSCLQLRSQERQIRTPTVVL